MFSVWEKWFLCFLLFVVFLIVTCVFTYFAVHGKYIKDGCSAFRLSRLVIAHAPT